MVAPGGVYGTYVDMDGAVRSEAQLVTKYRDMEGHPEVDSAIEDIVNEAIVNDSDEPIVTLNLDDTDFPDQIKERIREEFEHILRLYRFNLKSYEVFRRWYVDGRLYYHVVVDVENLEAGIKDLRYVDPRKIRKVREVKRSAPQNRTDPTVVSFEQEYFVYNPKGFSKATGSIDTGGQTEGVRLAKDSIINVTSGLLDKTHTTVVSYLHKAIKPLNNLRSLEDSVVIYRVSRAPERRIFYIDVGNLPKVKAEQYVESIMEKFKNRIVYNSATGEMRDDRKFMCYALDTRIPLLDGRTLTISDIIDEYQAGRTNWVYSCDPVTGRFYPGPISWAGVTKEDSEVVRVTFDNGKSVVCTPDHKFPTWGKGFIEAKDLQVGESLIPGYRRTVTIDGITHEQIFKNDTKEWASTRTEVERFIGSILTDKIVRSDCKLQVIREDRPSEQLHNHKVVSVEFLAERQTVAALTIDQDETYHSHHTYLLDAGVYTKNTMLEDFWLPRREGGRGTEISTLPAGASLGELADVEYFLRQLYKALNVPVGRLESQTTFQLGRGTEISRDEDKFSRFINRLRLQFSDLFLQALEKQLVLRKVLRIEDWDRNFVNIRVRYAKDSYYAEIREAEIMQMRIETLQMLEPQAQTFVGVYWSRDDVMNQVLKMTEDQIVQTKQKIAADAAEESAAAAQKELTDVEQQAAVHQRAQELGIVIDPRSGEVMPPQLMKPDPTVLRDG